MASSSTSQVQSSNIITSHNTGGEDDVEVVDESYPLLRRAHHSLLSVTLRSVLLFLLFAILFGGIVVGIWLIIDNERTADVTIVSRSEWDARPALSGKTVPLPVFPPIYVIIIHTASVSCNSATSCEEAVRKDQNYFMDELKFADIGYNFLIGGDGRVYEGRGYTTQGSFARGYNNRSLGVAFIGNFEKVSPPQKQLDVAEAFLQYAVDKKQLTAGYRLIGHKQVSNTTSPGQQLYDIIRHWPHWDNCYRNC